MFHISRSVAIVVTGTLSGPKPESQTIADVWARSIVSQLFLCVPNNDIKI